MALHEMLSSVGWAAAPDGGSLTVYSYTALISMAAASLNEIHVTLGDAFGTLAASGLISGLRVIMLCPMLWLLREKVRTSTSNL